MRFKVHFDFWADIESTIWHFEPILSRQFEISADIESKLRHRTRFMCIIAYKKCVNDPPKEFFSKVGHARIVPYTKLKLHARNQQNIMNSYRKITTSVFSLIQKSLRPLFLRKKPLTKIFFDPPKITPQTPQAFYSTVGPSPPSLLPPIPLETHIYIDPKKKFVRWAFTPWILTNSPGKRLSLGWGQSQHICDPPLCSLSPTRHKYAGPSPQKDSFLADTTKGWSGHFFVHYTDLLSSSNRSLCHESHMRAPACSFISPYHIPKT